MEVMSTEIEKHPLGLGSLASYSAPFWSLSKMGSRLPLPWPLTSQFSPVFTFPTWTYLHLPMYMEATRLLRGLGAHVVLYSWLGLGLGRPVPRHALWAWLNGALLHPWYRHWAFLPGRLPFSEVVSVLTSWTWPGPYIIVLLSIFQNMLLALN